MECLLTRIIDQRTTIELQVVHGIDRLDGDWHHIAVTWESDSGKAALYFDGEPQTPFWRATGGRVEQQYLSSGGVDSHIAWGTDRQNHGAS